jgi:hypothetical protein
MLEIQNDQQKTILSYLFSLFINQRNKQHPNSNHQNNKWTNKKDSNKSDKDEFYQSSNIPTS